MSSPDWYLTSHHGVVLLFIVSQPGSTISDMSKALRRTPRTIWSAVMDLQRADMLRVERQGRRHHYCVNPDARFEVPSVGEFPLRVLIESLANEVVAKAISEAP